MKAIVFDVDGVIIISAKQKNQAIKKVLQKHELFDVPGVAEILAMSLNRKVLLQKISLLHSFDTQIVLADINAELGKLENKPEPIPQVIDFIKKNHKKYLLFTNTSLPRTSLERILSSLDLSHCFEKLFSGDDGFKKDNINLIIQEYGITPDNILFIDDTLSHIKSVSETGAKLLHFDDPNIDISDRVLAFE